MLSMFAQLPQQLLPPIWVRSGHLGFSGDDRLVSKAFLDDRSPTLQNIAELSFDLLSLSSASSTELEQAPFQDRRFCGCSLTGSLVICSARCASLPIAIYRGLLDRRSSGSNLPFPFITDAVDRVWRDEPIKFSDLLSQAYRQEWRAPQMGIPAQPHT